MVELSRRQFLQLAMASSLICALPAHGEKESHKELKECPATISVLHEAYIAEMSAYEHYESFRDKALQENYPNIAYLFHAFSVSEEIHADNYKAVLESSGEKMGAVNIEIHMKDTKKNLREAANIEMRKIEIIYPELLKKLESEAYDEAVSSCMYSWKSHQQHKDMISELLKYARFFLSVIVGRIEEMKFDFYVCKVCGSTLAEQPLAPCFICNKSMANYQKIQKPV
ncbi:MAG: rubrerythrin family protein [Nitrospiraceae bacterium]|nr:MAG: rubrerythrin family protein [Nitrospiraceae bacterium]